MSPPAPWRRLLAASAWLLCAAGAQAADPPLPPAVADALRQAGLPADALAAVVVPVDSPAAALGRGWAGWKARFSGVHWQAQPDRAMQPGSAIKLLTVAVALDRLGPNVSGFTELLTRAPQQGDVLAGDLVLRGGADPDLGLPQLWALLAELRHGQGIREIAGDIVLDRHLFRPARPDLGAAPFDETPDAWYNVVPDALNLGGGLTALALSSQDPAQPGAVTARILPPLAGLTVDTSAMRLVEQPCRDWQAGWASPPPPDEPVPGLLRLRLQGRFPAGCEVRTWLQLIDRNALAERQLRSLWDSLGGRWAGRVREADAPLIAPVDPAAATAATATATATTATAPAAPSSTPPAAPAPALPGASTLAPGVAWAGTSAATPPGVRVLARHVAPPLGEVLRRMIKPSDPPLTRLLYLQLGLADMAAEPTTDTAVLAERSVRRWLAGHAIDTTGLVLDNGSGLSRSERITPRQLAQVLQAAHAGRWAPELLMSLPVVGVDGTMRNRLKTGPAAGLARMKTGTLRNVAALAGFVDDPAGRRHVLVAIINHDQARAGRAALDALVDWVARGGVGVP
jgi:D-alanyl-D-alanine carboxypeptidase/D-alanyl-D-alanine-endopeptidase (penicillin-binding protein 4)